MASRLRRVVFDAPKSSMREPNKTLYPSGGYKFLNSDGVTLVGTSWETLEIAVMEHRKRHGLPPGEPWKEICAQYCTAHPELCSKPWGAQRHPDLNGTSATVLDWLDVVRKASEKGELEFVSPEEAKRRAAICKKCPLRVEWPSCVSCSKPTQALRWRILRGQQHSGAELGACTKFRIDLYVAVSLKHDFAPSARVSDVPKECWKR